MNKKGFTLLEILVGMAILAFMATMIWQISSGNIDAKERVEKRDEVFQMSRIAIERIVDDLEMAFLVTNSQFLGKAQDGTSAKTIFKGEDTGHFDTVNFASFSNWRMFRNSKESDQAEIGYYVVPDEEERDLYRLMRRVSPYFDNNGTEGGRSEPVAENISSFDLEYYDGRQGEWTKEWNSEEVDQKDKLPRAVKVTLSFTDPSNEEEKINFETTAFIELWQYPIEF